MTENQQGVSAYPLPPMQYANLFSDDSIKRGRAPPPPPPITDTYMMFGAQFTADDAIIRPLEASNCRRLYPNNFDHKRELKKINHSILINFLDLLEVLIQSPESHKRQEKIDDMQILFINMHHLINEFRPHQARETLRVMMELQKKKRLETAERFQKHLDKVKELIESSVNAIPEDMDSKVLVTSELLQKQIVKTEVTSASDTCDRLDEMMTDIVDGMS